MFGRNKLSPGAQLFWLAVFLGGIAYLLVTR